MNLKKMGYVVPSRLNPNTGAATLLNSVWRARGRVRQLLALWLPGSTLGFSCSDAGCCDDRRAGWVLFALVSFFLSRCCQE